MLPIRVRSDWGLWAESTVNKIGKSVAGECLDKITGERCKKNNNLVKLIWCLEIYLSRGEATVNFAVKRFLKGSIIREA